MRNRVERLRFYLLGSAVFLVLTIAAFIGSARYLRHRFLTKLPAKLGVNIVRETNGYTYCQSVQGRNVYCIHAAKAVEHTDGKIALHDVSIALYGKKGDRSDHVYGDEFEYDQSSGVVRATGVVHIDIQAAGALQAAGAPNAAAAPASEASAESSRVMHVTTSGLVYLQKLGVAATSEYIEFESGRIKGHATGADYSSDSGVLTLHSSVSMSGAEAGRPFTLQAGSAEFDDRSQQAHLTHATYAADGRTAAADQATLYRRPDGTISRVEAQGDVTGAAKGATMGAGRADVSLTAASQPQRAVLTGGVTYSSDEPLRQARGQAQQATIGFDAQAQAQPQHAVFDGAVHLTEQTRASAGAKEPWSTRELTAATVVAELVPDGPGRSALRDAEASGSPRVTLVNNGSPAARSGAGTTELAADELQAHLLLSGDARQPSVLDTIVGRGHTVLRQIGTDGVQQTSTGDRLDARFRQNAAGLGKPAGSTSGGPGGGTGDPLGEVLATALQQGNVTVLRSAPAKKPPAGSSGPGNEVQQAKADRGLYDGDRDRFTLSGGVQVEDAGSVLWADQVALDHASGDAHATGAVKVNYLPEAAASSARTAGAHDAQANDPTHILAERADFDHAAGTATFYGMPGNLARMWQAGNQVQAPEIEFSQAQRRLIARGDVGTGWSGAVQAEQVRTVLTEAPRQAGPGASPGKSESPACAASGPAASPALKAGAAAGGEPGNANGVVKIASGGLVYSDVLRQADFTGGFRADTVDGTIRANEGLVSLEDPKGGPGGEGRPLAPAQPSLAGSLDRVVATGRVQLDKPGLRATGERLVYTASDRTALLTGDKNAPPTAVDAQGTTTGAELRFRSFCDGSGGGSVEVLGAPGQGVQSDAQLVNGKKNEGKKQGKKEKGQK